MLLRDIIDFYNKIIFRTNLVVSEIIVIYKLTLYIYYIVWMYRF